MKSNIAIDMGKLWVSSYGPKCCQPIKLQGSLKCNIVRKKCMMKFFLHTDKRRNLLQGGSIILSEWKQACPK